MTEPGVAGAWATTTAFVYVAQWEYQCCGSLISVGDTVDLTVHPDDWAEPWRHALPEPVTLIAEHHVPPDESWHLRVHVDQLWEARVRRAPRPGHGSVLYPVADSGEIAEITSMRRWDDAWQPARHGGEPDGWIMRVTVIEDLPARPDGLPYGL